MVRIILLASLVVSPFAGAESGNDKAQFEIIKPAKVKKKAKKEKQPVLILNLEDLYTDEGLYALDEFVETQTSEAKPQKHFKPSADEAAGGKKLSSKTENSALIVIQTFNQNQADEAWSRQFREDIEDYSALEARTNNYRDRGFTQKQIDSMDPGQGNAYDVIKGITGKRPPDAFAYFEVRPYSLFIDGASAVLVFPFQPRKR